MDYVTTWTERQGCDTFCKIENFEIHSNLFTFTVHTPSLAVVVATFFVGRFVYRKYKAKADK